MTTIVNTPGTGNDNSSSGVAAVVITVLILGTLLFVFIVYGLPMIRNNQQPAQKPTTKINVELPTPQPAPAPATPEKIN
ncbi:MAG: hypothetical protein AAB390_01370 [Patescibacteria group bacterium]